jgi:hypothetical protein
MSPRMAAPGPSFVREERVRLRPAVAGSNAERPEITLGMSPPSIMDDGWWLTHLWAAEGGQIVDAVAVAPAAGPPPEPPVAVLGRVLAGALAGLLDQEDGRQLIRVRMPPADDESRPWHRPLVLMTAVRWDPVRAAVMRPNELARELLRAFARATEAAASPA